MSVDVITGQEASGYKRPGGEINVKGLCTTLRVETAALPRAIGISRQTVSNYFKPNASYLKLRHQATREFFFKLNHVYVLIKALMDEDTPDERIVEWFHSPNRALEMKSPKDLVYENKLDVLIKKLMDVLTAAQGG